MPANFDQERSTYYAALKLPDTPDAFIAGLKRQMREALTRLHDGLPANEYVKIEDKNRGRIRLSPMEVQPEPVTLAALAAAFAWLKLDGWLDLIEIIFVGSCWRLTIKVRERWPN